MIKVLGRIPVLFVFFIMDYDLKKVFFIRMKNTTKNYLMYILQYFHSNILQY